MKINDIVQLNNFDSALESDVENLRVVIIGAGKMAGLHLETLKHIKGVELVGICNRSSDAGEKLAHKYAVKQTFKDPSKMLQETAPDAVIIAVSHQVTVEVATLVIEKGIPCLLEKPAGYSSEETANLANLALQNNCYNMVALNRRFYSVINQAILAVLHYGPIKGILIEAHEPIQRFRSSQQFGSWLYDKWLIANTIHAIDLFRMIGGDITKIESFSRSTSETFGDSFAASIEFQNGILGTFVSHWNSGGGTSLKIYGNGVVAELSPLEAGFVSFSTGRRIKLKPDWADKNFKPGLYNQMTTFLQDVKEQRKSSFPASDLQDNVKTMELAEAIQNS